MKNVISKVLCLLLVLSMLLCIAACGEDEESDIPNSTATPKVTTVGAGGDHPQIFPHTHEEAIDAAVAPTCTQKGKTEGKHCKICGDVLAEQIEIPATGHTYKDGYCSVCHVSETAVASGTCGEHVTWSLERNKTDSQAYDLTIAGTGAMNDYLFSQYGDVPWAGYRSDIVSVTVSDGVTHISDCAFYHGRKLKNVTFGSNSQLESIGDRAFLYCEQLEKFEIPETVISIGYDAFDHCSKLIQTINGVEYVDNWAVGYDTSASDITLQSNTVGISDQAFYRCSTLEYLSIPSAVKTIGNSAFSACDELKNVTLSEGLIRIGSGAFSSCTAMWSISIPASVTSLGDALFGACSNLSTVEVNDDSLSYSTKDGILYNKNQTALVFCPSRQVWGDFTIPTGVIRIEPHAFSSCTLLTGITIPAGATTIGGSAFSGCTSLTSISMPESIVSIGNSAFSDCTALTEIAIPANVKNIDDYAFSECINLKDVIFADNSQLTNIGEGAFYLCEKLTSIFIPASVTNIGNDCDAFFECPMLTEFIVSENNPVYSSQEGVLYNKDKTTLLYCPDGFSGNLIIPASVTRIGDYAFLNCSNLTDVVIPDGVVSIGVGAFTFCTQLIEEENGVSYVGKWVVSCDFSTVSIELRYDTIGMSDNLFDCISNLTSIIIPDGVKFIGEAAFCYCQKLSSIKIPASVIYIGSNAFYECDNLTIYAEAASQPLGWDDQWNYNGTDYLSNTEKYISVVWDYKR